MSSALARLEAIGRWTEDLLLSFLLLALIGLASWQIIGRNLFGTTVVVGDELLRIMVLWLTLVGAMAASRADRHIAISLIDRWLSGGWLRLVRVVNHVFTAVVCAFLCWYSYGFVQMSREFEDTLLGDVPAWWLQAPLVVGFGVMAWRHTLKALAVATGPDGGSAGAAGPAGGPDTHSDAGEREPGSGTHRA